MKFKGKIAIWYWFLIIGINFIILYELLIESKNFYVMLFSLIIGDLILVPNVVRNYVIIKNNTVYLYFGVFKDSIRIEDIELVKNTHNPIASSAASLDRILIKGRRNEMIIALEEKEKFINELKERNPRIK